MDKKPNIVLFFTDQQRYDTIHALGNPIIKTPALDRIVREGTAFTSCYSPSPVCVPARACMHYGRYPNNINCCENWDKMPDTDSFMKVLSDNGYYTHGVGKCHFTPDRDALRGFDSREIQEEVPCINDDQDYMNLLNEQGFSHAIEPHGVRGELYYMPQTSNLPARLHPTQWVGNRSINFIENRKEEDGPWMLFSSYIHPHPPFCPPSPWHKLYRPDLMPEPKIPEAWQDLQVRINRVQNRYKARDAGLNMHLLRCLKAHYYACISFVDYQIGRIIDALEKRGELDNTLILFSSDHGEHMGDYRCFGKRSMHDSCSRVPMLARLPGRFKGGAICDEPTSLIDIAPTILGAAGIESPTVKLDGVDLKDVSDGNTGRTAVFSQIDNGRNAIYTAVTKRYKYAYSAHDEREYLFDRVYDAQETQSVAAHSLKHTATEQMRALTIDWVKSCETETIRESALDGDEWRKYEPDNYLRDPMSARILQDPDGCENYMAEHIPSAYLEE